MAAIDTLMVEIITGGIKLKVQYDNETIELITHRGDYTIWWAE